MAEWKKKSYSDMQKMVVFVVLAYYGRCVCGQKYFFGMGINLGIIYKGKKFFGLVEVFIHGIGVSNWRGSRLRNDIF